MLTDEQIDDLKRRDKRFAELALSLDLQMELRDSKAVRIWMDFLEDDASKAIAEIIELSPLDSANIANLQVRIKTYYSAKRAFKFVIDKGEAAEDGLRGEDTEEI